MTRVLTGPVSECTFDEYKRQAAMQYPQFESEEEMFGSWLSTLTGVNISSKGVSFQAPNPIQFVKQVVTNPIADVGLALLIPGVGSAVAAGASALPGVLSGAANAVRGLAGAATAAAAAKQAVSSVTGRATTPAPSVYAYTTPTLPQVPAAIPQAVQANLMAPTATVSGVGVSPYVLVGGALVLFLLMQKRGRLS